MIAGIFISGLVQGDSCTELSGLLSRGKPFGRPIPDNYEQAVVHVMGCPGAGIGYCRAVAAGLLENNKFYLCADPVHLFPNRDQLIMDVPMQTGISSAESRQFISELNSHFADEELNFHEMTAWQWILSINEYPDISTHVPESVIGRHVLDYLPAGNKALEWHARLTEMQTLMHMSSINDIRAEEGKAPVNSVWLWGEGETADLSMITWGNIYSDDRLVTGLARAAECRAGHIEELDWNSSDESVLLVLTPSQVHTLTGSIDSYEHYCEIIWQYWMRDAVSALKQGRMNEIRIYTEECPPFVLNRMMLYRWWRKNKPVSACKRKV